MPYLKFEDFCDCFWERAFKCQKKYYYLNDYRSLIGFHVCRVNYKIEQRSTGGARAPFIQKLSSNEYWSFINYRISILFLNFWSSEQIDIMKF